MRAACFLLSSPHPASKSSNLHACSTDKAWAHTHKQHQTNNKTDKFGAAFAIVRGDIQGNIDRLETRRAAEPERFAALFEIVRDEVARSDADHGRSCTKGLLWLKRCVVLCCVLLLWVAVRKRETRVTRPVIITFSRAQHTTPPNTPHTARWSL